MQDNRLQREQIYKDSQWSKQWGIWRFMGLCLAVPIITVIVLVCVASCGGSIDTSKEFVESAPAIPPVIVETQELPTLPAETEKEEEAEAPILSVRDPNNSVYPYSTMSTDWEVDVYKQGWKYYELPSSYKMTGGMLPEVAQVYLWCICREAGVDYYTVLALIERESGYKYDATGDSGNSKGLMQIYEKFHLDRMEALNVTDLYNPYSNMRVGVDFLAEIQDRYLVSSGEHCVLMVYNMGATGAKKLWDQGIYSTAYTRQILQRAQEIRQELQE